MSRCGICGHTILDLHHCGECVDALRAALARETERAEKAERERDIHLRDAAAVREERDVARRWNQHYLAQINELEPRARAAESERDSLRSQLDALGNDLTLTRGAMAADDARLREAAIRVWGEHVRGCDTPDEMADLIRELRRQLAALSHLGTGAGRRAG